jgi:DNA-binding LacI/PurR family transcriptional regulator
VGRTTLKDVGDHVGTSAKTVSNVINGTGWVSDELKQRVRTAIEELGYRPNAAARQLRLGRSGMITLALPDLAQPYFAELASALVRAAEERSVTVLINQTNGQLEAERRISNGIGVPVTDAVILSSLALTAEDMAERTDTAPLVLLGEHIASSRYHHVTVDNEGAALAATKHLLSKGRRRIAAIGAKSMVPRETADLRLAGYRAALSGAGIAIDDGLVCVVDQFERADGAAAAERLLDSATEFDAVFAFNDLLALGAMHTLVSRGVRVPEDVAIIGFDDIEEGRYSTPALTTVSPNKVAIAHAALELALGEIDEAADDFETTIPFEIVERASS